MQDTESTTDVKIAAEMYFSGHKQHLPVFEYLKNDPSMNSLIKLRMATEGTFNKQNYEIQLIESSGINRQVSMEIDEFVSKFKCHLNISMTKQFQKESKCSLIYEIEF